MTDETRAPNLIARRSLVAGASAGLIAGTAMATGSTPSLAQGPRFLEAPPNSGPRTAGSPVSSTLAGPVTSGLDYKFQHYYDFLPEGAATRLISNFGAYPSVLNYMVATHEVPPGAFLREVEWYVYNGGSTPVDAITALAFAGALGGYILNTTSVPGGSSNITATRASIAADSYGPYPQGTKIFTYLYLPSDHTVQINGVRLGFGNGCGLTATRALTRAYDTRQSSALATGETRTIDLHAYALPGTTALLLSITILQPSATCYLKAFAGNAAAPTGALLYATPAGANAGTLTVPVSADGKIKVFASSTMHITIDVAGSIG